MSLTVPISLLDRSRARVGEPPGRALRDTIDRAVRAESLGLSRIWVAEHHSVPGIESGSPTLLMAAIGERTSTIRIASGGVMLPNHRPFLVAERARMLASLHPGRIDLGIGRSLGFTGPVRAALGVESYDVRDLVRDLAELLAFLDDAGPVTPMPARVPAPPVYLLATGSGLAVAAELGLAVVVGGPVLHGDLAPLAEYRRRFRPSARCPEPRVLVSVDVMIAPTPELARERLLPEAWAAVASRTTGAFPLLGATPPAPLDGGLTARQQGMVDRHLEQAVHGTPEQVESRLAELVARTGASEVVAFSSAVDREALAWSDEALAAMTGG